MNTATEKRAQLLAQLQSHGQSHLLNFWDELNADQQRSLQRQLARIDFELVSGLLANDQTDNPWADLASRAEPPPAVVASRLPDGGRRERTTGGRALADGEVGFVLVAGGQGTRLGFEHPKGMLPVGPISDRPLFAILLDQVRVRGQRTGRSIPVYIMTSDATHDETLAFFETHRHFGMNPADIHFFCQSSLPAVDAATSKYLMASRHQVSTSPDGHGGMLSALVASGGLDDMRRRGLKYLFYGQVDNPLLQVCDAFTIGAHILRSSEMTTQVIRKTDPLHRVGNVVSIDSRLRIIEYSDLPDSYARATNPDGSLRLWAGSIAVHVFDLDFLDRVQASATSLPFHRARKLVPYLDPSGRWVEPESPNAVKFERFIFDLLPEAQGAIVVEIDPADGFAPIKNDASAASETLATAQAAMISQHRQWLKLAGCPVDDAVRVEIHPEFAIDAAELAERWTTDRPLPCPAYLR